MHEHRIIPLCSIIFLSIITLRAEQPAVVSSIKPGDLVEYEQQSPALKKIIETSLGLTSRNLCYTYGSDSPSKGGMDCSGTISYVLKSSNIPKVPRSSYTIYHWANDHGKLTKLKNVHDPADPSLRQMKPGDLVFWEGTYAVKDRNPPISHVMLYLGTLKKDGKGVLFGASSGRRFRGKRIHGVSVFDFKVPSATSKARMVAYGPIPGLPNEEQIKAPEKSATAPRKKSESPAGPPERIRKPENPGTPTLFNKIFSNKR